MSTEKKIIYDTPDQNVFKHDNTEILIDPNGAALIKKPLLQDEMSLSSGRITKDPDRNIGVPKINYLLGKAVWNVVDGFDLSDTDIGGYVSWNDDSGRDGITPLSPTEHFNFKNSGAVRFKFKPKYSAIPSEVYYIFTSGDSVVSNGLGSLFTLLHETDGKLKIILRNAGGGSTTNVISTVNWLPSLGTEYEIEVNFEYIAIGNNSVRLFIDGALVASAINTVNIGGGLSRDFFYLGTYYISPFKSKGMFKDVQIFDEVQHTANFASEVPRIVQIYPIESKITPTEFSLVDGFDGLTHDLIIVETANVRYLMLIEEAEYYLDGGVMTVSDGSYVQSNDVSEWIHPSNKNAINALLSTGARIVMVPILFSGVAGCCASPLLKSTTLEYNFFAIPVGCDQCTLYGFVSDNCVDIVSGTGVVYVEDPIITQGVVHSFREPFDIQLPNGLFEVPLVIPNLPTVEGRKDDVYLLDAEWTDINDDTWKLEKVRILIPNQPTVLFDENIIKKGR